MAHRRGRGGCRARPAPNARREWRPSAAITSRAGMRRFPAAAHAHASDMTAVDDRALDHAVFVELRPCRDRLADQPVIEHAALDRVPDDAAFRSGRARRRCPAR